MCISISDWIGISQAVILLLTGGAIVWYTVETARIRKETSTQNSLLAEQLRIMRTSVQRDIDKEISFIKPYFVFGGVGQYSPDKVSLNFENKGAPAYKLSLKPIDSFSINVTPSKILETDGSGKFTIVVPSTTPRDAKFRFELQCFDRLNNPHLFQLYYCHYKGIFEENK
jgi:hypothetical protein